MTIFNLLNAIKLDQNLLTIIICLAAALLVAVIFVVVCTVRAKKRRNQRVNETTNDEETRQDTVTERTQETSAVSVVTDEETIAKRQSAENVTAHEDVPQDVDEEISVQLAEQGSGSGGIVYSRTIYNRSFLARVTQASDYVKERYSALKNYLLSYQKVKPALSWKRESFRIGRSTFACFVMRGKKLCLCFAADPKRFEGTKYKVVDLSLRSPKSKQPCKYRIISERRVKYAKEIIDMLMAEMSVDKLAEFAEQRYTMPYRETDALIADGLIRVKIIEGVDQSDFGGSNVASVREVVNVKDLPQRDFEILEKVEATEVNVMSDAEATKLIEYKVVKRKKSKGARGIINIDVLSKKFEAGSHITTETLHEMRIIPNNVNSIKVLAKGILDKPLIVEADDFSLAAVKMIALTGGRVIRTSDK